MPEYNSELEGGFTQVCCPGKSVACNYKLRINISESYLRKKMAREAKKGASIEPVSVVNGKLAHAPVMYSPHEEWNCHVVTEIYPTLDYRSSALMSTTFTGFPPPPSPSLLTGSFFYWTFPTIIAENKLNFFKK